MSKMTWLWFTLIRLAVFIGPLIILLILGIEPWIAAVLAAIIGWSISYIFFSKTRNRLSQEIYERRQSRKHVEADEHAEDEEIEKVLKKKDSGNAQAKK